MYPEKAKPSGKSKPKASGLPLLTALQNIFTHSIAQIAQAINPSKLFGHIMFHCLDALPRLCL